MNRLMKKIGLILLIVSILSVLIGSRTEESDYGLARFSNNFWSHISGGDG